MLRANGIRRDNRGSAGFALVAVGLLIAGGAAAVYLRSVEDSPTQSLQQDSLEQQALRREAEQEADLLDGIAMAILEAQVNGNFAAGNGAVSRVSNRFSTALEARLNATYPRTNSQGHVVAVNHSFARVVAETETAQIASPLGGLAELEMPVFLAAEAGAEVLVEAADGANATGFSR